MIRRILTIIILANTLVFSNAQTTSCPGAPDSRLVVGEQAQIAAIGGSNLRVRPNADATLLDIIPEGAIIPVIDGPFCGGFAWWQVDYEGERGWVAEGLDDAYWLNPYIIQRTQIGTVAIEVQPTLTSTIKIERLPDPPRNQFVLEGFPVQSNQWIPFIVVFDSLPETIPTNNNDNRAQVLTVNTGERAIEINIPEDAQTTDDISLVYHFSSVLDDNRFVDAYFPVIAPDLPLAYTRPDDEIEQYTQVYLEASVLALENLAPDDFTPTLAELDSIIQSINYNAPVENSNQLTFSSDTVSFDYHPLLATSIVENRIGATDTVPQHIQYTFTDYPADEAIIRIYRTDDLNPQVRLSMQQILQRQSSNPPAIPVPSQQDTAGTSERTGVQYQQFTNGSGVRYITGDNTYHYQALSDDGQYFISAQFALSGDNLLLQLFDRLFSQLEITG